MRYTYEDIIKLFNKKLVELIADGWVMIPHNYYDGYLHEIFIRGNEAKRLEIDRCFHGELSEDISTRDRERINLKVYTGEFTGTIEKYSSWDFKTKDRTTELIHVFYRISESSNCNQYVDSLDEFESIVALQNKRSEERYRCGRYTSLPDGATSIALKWARKQPKCKTATAKDVTRVFKEIVDGHSHYYAVVKNNFMRIA